jgi:hypothetical protein
MRRISPRVCRQAGRQAGEGGQMDDQRHGTQWTQGMLGWEGQRFDARKEGWGVVAGSICSAHRSPSGHARQARCGAHTCRPTRLRLALRVHPLPPVGATHLLCDGQPLRVRDALQAHHHRAALQRAEAELGAAARERVNDPAGRRAAGRTSPREQHVKGPQRMKLSVSYSGRESGCEERARCRRGRGTHRLM